MTAGIYSLHFCSTDKVYIGQSSNIEDRFKRHSRDLLNMVHHSTKLQRYYNSVNTLPDLSILLEETDVYARSKLEHEYIEEFNSYNNGFNSTEGGDTVAGTGYQSVNAMYTKDVYVQIVKELAFTSTSLVEIAEMLDVSINVVHNISAVRRHTWIEQELPLEYEIIKNKNLFKARNKSITSEIQEVFLTLAYTDIPRGKIPSILNTSQKTVDHILYGSAYKWLKNIYPLEYDLMRKSRLRKLKC